MSNRPEHILVIGAGLGGLRTIESLRKDGYRGRITLVGDEPYLPYDRPPLSKQFLAGDWQHERISLVDEAGVSRLSVKAKLGTAVVSLVGRRAELADGTVLDADAVIVCTGVKARRIPGQTSKFHTLRTLSDAIQLRAQLTSASTLLVVGAGFVGTEIASTAVELGVRVTVLETMSVPFSRTLGSELGEVFARLHAENGVDLRCGVTISGFDNTETGVSVTLADRTVLAADVGVVGIGGIPDLGWLSDGNLTINNGIRCNSTGRALGSEHIWAVGDVASWRDDDCDAFDRSEHWNSTVDQAGAVSAALLGKPAMTPPETYFWSDQFGLKIQVLGKVGRSESIEQLHGSGLTGGPIKKTVVGHFQGERLVAVTGFGAPAMIARYRPVIAGGYDRGRVRSLAQSLEQRATSATPSTAAQ